MLTIHPVVGWYLWHRLRRSLHRPRFPAPVVGIIVHKLENQRLSVRKLKSTSGSKRVEIDGRMLKWSGKADAAIIDIAGKYGFDQECGNGGVHQAMA